MAGERRINLGTDATDARYQIEDPGPDGDLVVRDSDNNREVFRYDAANDEFELRDASATAINTDVLSISGQATQFALDGYVVPVSEDISVSDAIDPGATTTPVQDAADLIRSQNSGRGSGTVLLPPEPVQEAATLDLHAFVNIVGWGADRDTAHGNLSGIGFEEADGSAIEFTQTGASAHGINFETTIGQGTKNAHSLLRGFTIRGPGRAATTGYAIEHPFPTEACHVENVRIEGWANSVWHGNTYQACVKNLSVQLVDPGQASAPLFDLTGGPINAFKTINVYPVDDQSATRTSVFSVGDGIYRLADVNIGADPGQIVEMTDANGGNLDMVNVNYEPETDPGLFQMAFIEGSVDRFNLRQVQIGGVASYNWLVNLKDGASDAVVRVEEPHDPAGATDGYLYTEGDITGGSVVYDGQSADVTNVSGSVLTGSIFCTGDVVKKRSTGQGYDGGTNDSQL